MQTDSKQICYAFDLGKYFLHLIKNFMKNYLIKNLINKLC